MDRRANLELNIRIDNAWRSFWALKLVLKNKMSLKGKINILEKCIIPTLTHWAQTVALTKNQVNKLNLTQNRIIGCILNVKLRDKIKMS